MIRVNLLKPRMSAVPDATKSGRKAKKRSAFISGYEAALGLLLLVGGATAMYFYFDGQVGDEESQPSPAGVATAPDDRSAEVAKEPGTASGALDATSAGTPPADGTAEPTGDAVASETVASASPVKPRAGVAKRPIPATPPAATPATARAASISASSPLRLSNLKISNRQGDLKMTAVMSGRPSYNKFRLNNPDRIVIDIDNARVGLRRSNLVQNVDHPLVRRIRVGQFKQGPWVARLVLDVTEFPNLLLFPHSGGLDIQVTKSGQ